MFEESVEGFVLRWKPYAASAVLFSRTEGSPLLECLAGGVILQAFERTGPYRAHPGPARLILNPTADRLTVHDSGDKRLETLGISRLRASGLVLLREGQMLVVDAGVPLVVGVDGDLPDDLASGSWVSFESHAPVHAFVVDDRPAPVQRRARADESELV